jgi:hypothetical protein
MKKKILIISISAVVLLVLASLSSVIGTTTVRTYGARQSPLFVVRTQRSIDTEEKLTFHSNYLGKGLGSSLFLTTKPSLSVTLDRTMKLLNKNPGFFTKILQEISSNPRITMLLQKYGITMAEVKTHLNRLKNDPSVFIEEIQNAEPKLAAYQLETPLPLGLNTSSVIGCVITAIVMIPVVLILALIVVVFTLRIIQCLRIDEIMNSLFDQILQELSPAGSYL